MAPREVRPLVSTFFITTVRLLSYVVIGNDLRFGEVFLFYIAFLNIKKHLQKAEK